MTRSIKQLTCQFKRAISIAANIVEGYKKKGTGDKSQLMNIAQSSIEGCHYYLILGNDPGHRKSSPISLPGEIGKILRLYMLRFYLLTPNFYILCSI